MKQANLERQIERLSRQIIEQQRRSDEFTRWRVFEFFGGLLLIVLAFNLANWAGYAMIALWLVVFAVLVYFHRQIKDGIARYTIWRDIKRQHLARMTLDWSHIPESSQTAPDNHPFALDIDLVGEYSIHRLLDTAVSRGGSTRLLDWLLDTVPDKARITYRQKLVRTLIPLTAFRDKLALYATLAGNKGQWQGERLIDWLESDHLPQISRSTVMLLGGIAALNIALFLAYQVIPMPPLWVAPFLVYLVLSTLQLRKLGDLFSTALTLQSELGRLRAVLQFLENAPYETRPDLKALIQPILTTQPSVHLRRVGRIVTATSLQRNPIVWFFLNLAVPWDIFFAYRLQQCRKDLITLLPRWLDTWYELEALNALANFAALNPSFTFPQVHDSGMTFAGKQLGHPLIPMAQRVNNDFTVKQPGEVMIVTGSNMSGKSSFLRTLGVNLCLTYAGGVVCASQLDTSLFRLFTCIKVSDSVVDGISYFYAEVRRLKALLLALQQPDALPLFFLIDEIFRGTNNRERLIGSRSYIQSLAGHNGCGLISTHDLELVRLEDEITLIRNLHFREEVAEGRMVFDYKLRSGPSPTTNALRIMEIEGLPVREG